MAQKLLEEHPSQKIILSEVKSMKNLDLRKIEGKGKKVDTPVYIFVESSAVSYTHLTLPTISSV